jgi:hypothetical protein
MKSARQPVSSPTKPSSKRRHRPRPTPRWLKAPVAEGPEGVAQRRTLLVLSVLSGEQPVTDAIEATGVSRQLYYQLEERALKAMMRALLPSAEGREEVETSLAGQVQALQARVQQLETEKRRAERLLLLTRKLIRPGPVKVGKGGRRPRASSGGGRSASRPARPTKAPATPPPLETSATPSGETTP